MGRESIPIRIVPFGIEAISKAAPPWSDRSSFNIGTVSYPKRHFDPEAMATHMTLAGNSLADGFELLSPESGKVNKQFRLADRNGVIAIEIIFPPNLIHILNFVAYQLDAFRDKLMLFVGLREICGTKLSEVAEHSKRLGQYALHHVMHIDIK